MKWFDPRLIASGAVALALTAPQAAAQAGELCGAALIPHPYPVRTIDKVNIGYSGTGYAQSGLVNPQMVPLSIESSDPDQMLVFCDGNCFPLGISAESDVDWFVMSDQGHPGAFVDALANEIQFYPNSTCCLYMPPDDLQVGEVRTAYIDAIVHEICQHAADPNTLVQFQVDVARNDTHDWDVIVQLIGIATVDVPPPDCDSDHESECEVVGPWLDKNPPVTATIVEYPSAGMIEGELRPIRCDAFDLDMMSMECGIPISCPPISNFAQSPKCDDMTYSWSVVQGPGNGTFMYQDRATLFRATVPGDVTVRVDVTTTDGETAFFKVQFKIVPAKVKLIEFKNHTTLMDDANWLLYNAPQWYDKNDDGDADDLLEQKFPVAYVAGKQVEFSLILIKAAAPAPKPMPGATLRGKSDTGTKFKGKSFWDAGGGQWVCRHPETEGKLPAKTIKKYDPYKIDWELDFGGGKKTKLNTTEHRIYVTLVTPNTPYGPHETIFDIACGKADGKKTAFEAAVGAWTYFKTRNVHRVGKNGWNQTMPQTRLHYWKSNPCQPTVQGLLKTTDGSCGAWARFLRAVLLINGLDSLLIGLEAPKAAGATISQIVVNDCTPPAGNGPWPWAAVTKNGSIPAQGTTNTQRFENHAVLLVGEILVDPSYGLGPFAGAKMFIDLENKILFGTIDDWNWPAGPNNVKKQDTTKADLKTWIGN